MSLHVCRLPKPLALWGILSKSLPQGFGCDPLRGLTFGSLEVELYQGSFLPLLLVASCCLQ